MSEKKPASQRILGILRDPAWGGVRAIQAILVVIGGVILVILAILIGMGNYLLQQREIPIWILVLLGSAGIYSDYSLIRIFWKRKEKVVDGYDKHNDEYYEEIWGALWLWSPSKDDLASLSPVCPEHKVPMTIEPPLYPGGDFRYICLIEESRDSHVIVGPSSHGVPFSSIYLYIAQCIRTRIRMESRQKIIRETTDNNKQ